MSTVFTIGHSNKSIQDLLDVLRAYGIDRLVDVRSRPFSRWCPQFNKDQLESFMAAFDINYDWRGLNLGGLEINTDYEVTLKWIHERASLENIVLLCSEANHKKCHRYLTLTPDLERLGSDVKHLNYENIRDDSTGLHGHI